MKLLVLTKIVRLTRKEDGSKHSNVFDIHVIVKEGCTIIGMVTDLAENPIAGVLIEHEQFCGDSSYHYYSERTDENGKYSITLPQNAESVSVSRILDSAMPKGPDTANYVKKYYDIDFTKKEVTKDFVLPFYSIELDMPESTTDEGWYSDEIGYIGKGKTLYLRPGTYELYTNSHTEKKVTGDYFGGGSVTHNRVRYKTGFTLENRKITDVLVEKDIISTWTDEYLPANETTYEVQIAEENSTYNAGAYNACKFTPDSSGKYRIESDEDVSFYDMLGNIIPEESNGEYDLKAGVSYIVGTGQLGEGAYFTIYRS